MKLRKLYLEYCNLFFWKKLAKHITAPGLCIPARPLDFSYRFTHPIFSCSNTPLLLLLISPSALTLSNLYFRNTSPKCFNWCFTVTGPETIFKHVPQFLMSYWIFSPIHQYRTIGEVTLYGKASRNSGEYDHIR